MFRAALDRIRSSKALLGLSAAIIALPTGVWLGVDALVTRGEEVDLHRPGVRAGEVFAAGRGAESPARGLRTDGTGSRSDAPAEAMRVPVGLDGLATRALDPATSAVRSPGVTLRGNVVADGPGVSGAVLIRALGPTGRVVDELGQVGAPYALQGLTAGEWWVVTRGNSTLETRSPVTIDADSGSVEQDLSVRAAPSLPVVFVTSWGERLERVLTDPDRDAAAMPLVEVLGAGLDSPLPGVLPELPAGRFVSSALGPDGSVPEFSGWVELLTPPPAEVKLVQAGRVIASRRITGFDEMLRFVVDPLEESALPVLEATLVDATTGVPVDDAIVELFAIGDEAPVRSRRASALGEVRMAGIDSGDWVLSAWSGGRSQLLHPFTIDGVDDYDLGELRLHPAGTISGRLLAPDGRPLGNRSLRWIESGRARRLAHGYGREAIRSDAGGMFVVRGVPDGTVTLFAGGNEFAAAVFEVETSGAIDAELELELSVGHPVSLAVDGDLDRTYELVVRDSEERAIGVRTAYPGRASGIVLANGSYTVELRDGSRLVGSRSIRIDGRPLELTLELDD